MTLREKLSLPAPQWVLFGAILLIVVGITKILMWIVPIAASGMVDALTWLILIMANVVMWLMPYIWQSIIFCAAGVCAIIVFLWRHYQLRRFEKDLASGYVIHEVHYEIR